MKICVDGGLRSLAVGAIAFSIHSAAADSTGGIKYTPVWMSAQPFAGATSAFQTEAMALDHALSCILRFLE